jgi:hypothetical protein
MAGGGAGAATDSVFKRKNKFTKITKFLIDSLHTIGS